MLGAAVVMVVGTACGSDSDGTSSADEATRETPTPVTREVSDPPQLDSAGFDFLAATSCEEISRLQTAATQALLDVIGAMSVEDLKGFASAAQFGTGPPAFEEHERLNEDGAFRSAQLGIASPPESDLAACGAACSKEEFFLLFVPRTAR